MDKISFVIKTFRSGPERDAGADPLSTFTAGTLSEFDKVVRDNDGRYFSFESQAGTKVTWQGCRFILDQQEKETNDVTN